MSLDIIDSECLSADETAQGAIAFFDGIIDVYDEASGGMVGYEVTQPSIFVDARIINLGRYRNTVAHECFHWWRHRNYFNFNRTHEKATEFGIRCERTSPRKDIGGNQWTDVERMEWHYTKAHLAECTLDFTKKLSLKPYLTHDASAYMMFRSDTEFQEKTTFDSNTQNIEFFNRAKDFENRFARYASIQKTVNELLMDYINISRWSKATFLSKTELDDMSWNRVKDKNYKFTIRPLVTIGKALDLSADEMEEVLNAAGLSLKKPDREIRAYQYLFSFPGMSIHDCNKLLDEIGDVPRLRSQERKIQKKTAGTK